MDKRNKLVNILKEKFKNHSISIEDYNETKTYILFVVEPLTGKIIFHKEEKTIDLLFDKTISKLENNQLI